MCRPPAGASRRRDAVAKDDALGPKIEVPELIDPRPSSRGQGASLSVGDVRRVQERSAPPAETISVGIEPWRLRRIGRGGSHFDGEDRRVAAGVDLHEEVGPPRRRIDRLRLALGRRERHAGFSEGVLDRGLKHLNRISALLNSVNGATDSRAITKISSFI